MESRLPEVAFCVSAKRLHQERRGAEVARQVHTLEVTGSNPVAATFASLVRSLMKFPEHVTPLESHYAIRC